MKKNEIQKNQHGIILYQNEDSNVCVSVYYSNETFWLTQKAMAELFGCSTDNISLHLKKIFSEGELDKDSVTEKNSATASDGKNYMTCLTFPTAGYKLYLRAFERMAQILEK